jgi:hypothetical protein
MKIKTFPFSLGSSRWFDFEVNITVSKWTLRIASRQLALWKHYDEVFNICRFVKN